MARRRRSTRHAYALGEGQVRTERRGRIRNTDLRIAGGRPQSDAALQLTADVFRLPVSRPHVYEASDHGAAIDAAVGLRLIPDFATAVEEMTRVGDTFELSAAVQEPHTSSIVASISACTLKSNHSIL